MPDLISPAARSAVAAAEAVDLDPALAPSVLLHLERELAAPRRLLVGGTAFLTGLVGSLIVAIATGGAAEGTDPVAALIVGLLGVTLLSVAAAVGVWVVLTGRRVARAHRRCSAAVPMATPGDAASFLFSGHELLRSAIVAGSIVLLAFAISLIYLATAPSDPAELGDGRTAILITGLGWAACAAVPTTALGLGVLRSSVSVGHRLTHWSRTAGTARRG